MAGAVVQPPGGGQPVNLKSALKKGSTRRKRQVVIDEAKNTYCEATSYFFEDVPLPRRRDLALRKAATSAQQKPTADSDSTTTMMKEVTPTTEPTETAAQTGRGGDGIPQRTESDPAPPADAGETTGSETGQKRVPSPQTLVTALLTDSLLALTPSEPRGDNHQFWRPNLPDVVTESVEGDNRNEDSPVKPGEPSGSPPAGDSGTEETAHTFRVIKEDDAIADAENGTDIPTQENRQPPSAPMATPIAANKASSAPSVETGSPKFSEIVPERPIPVLLTDTDTDCDAESPRKPTKTNQQTVPNGRISGRQTSADSFAKSPLGMLNTGGSPGSDPAEPGSPSSDTDLSGLSNADSPDRFWKLSTGSRSLSDFPISPATSSGSSTSSSPPAWDRSPSGSPPRRSPPSISTSLDASRDSPPPGDSPPPTPADDGYSLDDIEDALRDEPPSPKVAPPPATSDPLGRPFPPSSQEEKRAEEQQRARQEQRGVTNEEGYCPERELAGFVQGQAARTERLRRRYAAAEDGGFIRRPSVRGVVIQQAEAGPTDHHHQLQQQQQQQQQQLYWQQQPQQQQPRQQPVPAGPQHPQLYRQNSAPLQPRSGQMAPHSTVSTISVHMRQQSAPMLPGHPEPLRQRPAQAASERAPQQQQQERLYGTTRPVEMHLERPVNGQVPRQVAPPPQPGRGGQPHPAQMQQYPAQMQPQTAPMHPRAGPSRQQPVQAPPPQQPGQSRPQDVAFVRSAHVPHMQPHQASVSNHPQQPAQHRSRNGPPHNGFPQPHQQQQQQQWHQDYQQLPQPTPRPLPMGQTRQQQLEQIRRLQDSHLVRVPAVTVGFPDESSRRQMARWNAPAWVPGEGGGGGGGRGCGRDRESFRTSRQRSASQQRLEAAGRPASLALPRAYEWPQERFAPPPPAAQPPQPPPRFCEPSVAPAGAGAGAVTLPRRYPAPPENTGSLPRHQRLGSGASQASVSGWPTEGPADPRSGGRDPRHLPFPQQQQQRAGWYPQQPAPGPSRWYEQSAAQQTTSVTPRGAGLVSPPVLVPEPLYGRHVQLQRYDDGHELSADEHDV